MITQCFNLSACAPSLATQIHFAKTMYGHRPLNTFREWSMVINPPYGRSEDISRYWKIIWNTCPSQKAL